MPDVRDTGAALKEKVEAEAAAAEETEPEAEPVVDDDPDQDEGAEEEETEVEPEPEPEGAKRGQSDPQRQFDNAMRAFARKLRALFEVEDLTPAPYPGVAGYMLPGFAEPRTHENYQQCTTCNGLGKVLTGAATGKPEYDWHACPDGRCKGRGYWAKEASVETPPQTGPLAVQPPTSENGEWAEAPAWMGDPNLSPAA